MILILAVGSAAGFTAGLFGVGGGVLMVPALAFIFDGQLGAGGRDMHMAIATSLAAIVPTALSSAWTHYRRGAVLWHDVGRLAPAIACGALIGVAVGVRLPALILARGFGLYALAAAVQIALDVRPARRPGGAPAPLPAVSVAGTLIGALSALIGVGGGTMTTPYLLWRGRSVHNAVAVSAACGLPIALIGVVGYIVTGWQVPGLPPWSSGYVYWPAGVLMGLASSALAPLGANLAHRVPERVLKGLYALLLTGIGVKMLMR